MRQTLVPIAANDNLCNVKEARAGCGLKKWLREFFLFLHMYYSWYSEYIYVQKIIPHIYMDTSIPLRFELHYLRQVRSTGKLFQ